MNRRSLSTYPAQPGGKRLMFESGEDGLPSLLLNFSTGLSSCPSPLSPSSATEKAIEHVSWSQRLGLAHSLALSKECHVAAGAGLQHIDELKEKEIQLKVRFDGNGIVQRNLLNMPPHQKKVLQPE